MMFHSAAAFCFPSLRYSVLRETPSAFAARLRLPPALPIAACSASKAGIGVILARRQHRDGLRQIVQW